MKSVVTDSLPSPAAWGGVTPAREPGDVTPAHPAAGPGLLDSHLRGFFLDVMRLSLFHPGRARFFARLAWRQRQARARRRAMAEAGVLVPPLMIVSVTRRCNLYCAGCFIRAQEGAAAQAGRSPAPRAASTGELTLSELHRLLGEAAGLGVSIVALAGGEPLTRPQILDLPGEHPEMLFLLVTNGSLLDEETIERLTRLHNVIPLISLEGLEQETDERRGGGVYQQALDAMKRMCARGVFFGTSIMVTRRNFALTTSRSFVRDLVERGSRLFFYVDYVPVAPGSAHLVPSKSQRRSEGLTMDLLRAEFPGIFLASSRSEEALGRCPAAGRGFIHVNPEGELEPCPFAPFSDVDVRGRSLREALDSRLLRRIRESEEHLSESGVGCALWTKREWVATLLEAGDDPEDDGSPRPPERLAA